MNTYSKTPAFLYILLLIANGSFAAENNRTQREAKMAESAVFWALIASESATARQDCLASALACSDDRADLGMALLGAKDSKQDYENLASLMRYKIDAGFSESYTCYILSKGTKILSSLRKADSEAMVNTCSLELKAASISSPKILNGIDPNKICESSEHIQQKTKNFIEAIGLKKTCSAEDF